jgi:sulfur carrier protein ThiS
MELYVNDSKLDITLENEKTVGDVLRSFEAEAAKMNSTTVAIVLNGSIVPASQFEKAAAQPLEENTKIELTVISQNDISCRFNDEAKLSIELADMLEQIPVQLQSGKDKEANGIITALADLIDKVCRTASLSALFPNVYKSFLIDGKSISEFFADFAPVLSDFEHALEAKDTVLVGDLAEYEISPRLRAFAAAVSAGSAKA